MLLKSYLLYHDMSSENTPRLNKFEPRMAPNDPDKLDTKRTIFISLSFFTVLLAWAYFNFKVPRLLDDILLPMGSIRTKQTIKGVILALDNLVAVILQPFFGNLSDRTCSKYGRRMPYIVLGTTLAAFFFTTIPLMQTLAGLVLIILCFDLAMAVYRSVSIAILPDYTPDKLQSKASAIQQFTANMGGVLAFTIPMIVTGFGIKEYVIIEGMEVQNQMFNIISFVIVSALMIAVVIIQIVLVKETPTGDKIFQLNTSEITLDPISLRVSEKVSKNKECVEESVSVLKKIGDIFRSDDKSFRNMLFTVMFAYTGFAAVEAFFSTFAQSYMGKADTVTGTLFLAYSVPMILSAYFWGMLGQKIGRKKAAVVGIVGVILSTFVLVVFLVPAIYNPVDVPEQVLTTKDYLVMVNLAFISMPWMCFIVNSFPLVWSLAPKGEVGTYTGVYYTFNQFAYTMAPMLLGLNLDFFQYLGPQQYVVMFPFVLICMIFAFLFLIRVNEVKEVTKESSEEDNAKE